MESVSMKAMRLTAIPGALDRVFAHRFKRSPRHRKRKRFFRIEPAPSLPTNQNKAACQIDY